MREAAFEIARQSDAFAPSLAHEALAGLMVPLQFVRDAWIVASLRARLSRLDDRQLDDIGITRSDIALLANDGLGARGALARLLAERRAGMKAADLVRFSHKSHECAWICTKR